MIGNDVIDLAQSRIESRWQRKGFVEKLFTSEEQQYIKDYKNPETMVWLLWSMKEAAYKIYNRRTKIREFSPKKLCCTLGFLNSNDAIGKVYYNENVYYTETIFSLESIHTIAVDNLENINHIIEVENKEIIKDENGIPYLKICNALRDVSISHHGRFEKWVTISK